jgi:molybdopterin adenylyltransferase
MTQKLLKVGILTISDRASAGVYEDLSGKAIKDYLQDNMASDWKSEYLLVPDSLSAIKKGIMQLADKHSCQLLLTTGGTGPSSRDVTPEATEAACSRMLPGFGERMRAASLEFVPTAILSRQTAGIRGNALVINLPGKPKAIAECLDAVFAAIPECIKLIGGPEIKINNDNAKIYH